VILQCQQIESGSNSFSPKFASQPATATSSKSSRLTKTIGSCGFSTQKNRQFSDAYKSTSLMVPQTSQRSFSQRVSGREVSELANKPLKRMVGRRRPPTA